MGGHAKKYKDGFRKNHELQNENLKETNLKNRVYAKEELETEWEDWNE